MPVFTKKNWPHKSNCKFYSLPRYYIFYISPTFKIIQRFQYVQVLSTNRKVNVWLSRYVDIHCTVYGLSLNDHHWVSHRRVLEYECEYKKVQCYRYNQSIFEVLFSNIHLTIKTEINEDYTWACLNPLLLNSSCFLLIIICNITFSLISNLNEGYILKQARIYLFMCISIAWHHWLKRIKPR